MKMGYFVEMPFISGDKEEKKINSHTPAAPVTKTEIKNKKQVQKKKRILREEDFYGPPRSEQDEYHLRGY